MIDNKNLILAVVLSVLILVGFEFYFKSTRPPVQPTGQTQQTQAKAPGAPSAPGAPTAPAGQPQAGSAPGAPSAPTAGGSAPQVPGTTTAPGVPRAEVLAAVPRVKISSPQLSGSIALKGGRIDDLVLNNYREELDKNSPDIILFSPKRAEKPYFADFGWVAGSADLKVPGADTLWTSSGGTLTPDHPVTLTWDNGQGQVFTRTYSVDKNFMFKIKQSVTNNGGKPVDLFPYGLISRHGTPHTLGYYILHEGMLGVTDGQLTEIKYKDIKEKKQETRKGTGGWIGITDKYWLAALVPDQKAAVTKRYVYGQDGNVDTYQVDYLSAKVQVAPGASAAVEDHLFAGAKEVRLLDGYEKSLGIDRFDLTIDWGWFYFLTRPIFYALLWLYQHVGNFGIAILLLTVSIKALFFPLANKSYASMSKMKKLQPEMVKLRERYADDKARLNQEMMALYKREGANPASGCLPILIQIPVFFSLYKVLFVTIEMRQAPFYGWIHDLSVPDPTNLFTLFGAIPWDTPHLMHIGIWPLLMGISMLLQQKLNPQPTDPMQAKVMMFLPVMFTFLLAKFPAGLVIYWTWNNLLSMAQQWVIMRRMGVKA